MTAPTPRTIRRALGVLDQLPPAAVALLVERLIDRLDALEPDADREDEHEGRCEAHDDDITGNPSGDDDDAEHSLGWHHLEDQYCLHGALEGDDQADAEDDDPAGREDMPPTMVIMAEIVPQQVAKLRQETRYLW